MNILKNKPILSVIVLFLIIASVVFYENPILQLSLLFAAYLAISLELKIQTKKYQIFVELFIAQLIGFAVAMHIGASMLIFVLITAIADLSFNFRKLNFEKYGYKKPNYIDFSGLGFATLLLVFAYFQLHNFNYIFLFAGAIVLYNYMMVLVDFMDRYKLEKTTPKYIEVGSPAPNFALPNEHNELVELASYVGKRNVLLIFVRGDWCPSCHIMLRTYQKHQQKFADKNVVMIAVGPDPVGVNKEMVMRMNLEYQLLSDPTQQSGMKYYIKTQSNMPPNTKYTGGIPLPASFLIDKNGIVQYTSRADIPGEILFPDTIIPILEKLSV